jgi:hypothetical protein
MTISYHPICLIKIEGNGLRDTNKPDKGNNKPDKGNMRFRRLFEWPEFCIWASPD